MSDPTSLFVQSSDSKPKRSNTQEDEEESGPSKRRQLGGTLPTLTERTKAQLEQGAAGTSTASAPAASPVLVRAVNPSPSSRGTLEPDDRVVDVVDLTDDLLQVVSAARPAAAREASGALPVPAPRSKRPKPKTTSVLRFGDGDIKGPTADVGGKVRYQYQEKLDEEANECAGRKTAGDQDTHIRLCGVVNKSQRAKNLDELVAVHEEYGKRALKMALSMHVREHNATIDSMDKAQEPKVIKAMREDILGPQADRIASVKRCMKHCDELLESISQLDYPEDHSVKMGPFISTETAKTEK